MLSLSLLYTIFSIFLVNTYIRISYTNSHIIRNAEFLFLKYATYATRIILLSRWLLLLLLLNLLLMCFISWNYLILSSIWGSLTIWIQSFKSHWEWSTFITRNLMIILNTLLFLMLAFTARVVSATRWLASLLRCGFRDYTLVDMIHWRRDAISLAYKLLLLIIGCLLNNSIWTQSFDFAVHVN
jgi:hypothetical protein